MKNPKQLPTLDNVKKGIDEIILIDNWTPYKIKTSPKKFEKRLRELFIDKLGILPHIVLPLNEREFPFKFYRLRKKTKSMNEMLFSEYSYPPNHMVKMTQRANIPFYPVFYSSDNPTTAIYETVRTNEKVNTNDIYYLSEWEIRKGEDIRVCPFLFGNVHEDSAYRLLSDVSITKVKEMLHEYSEDETLGFIEILKLLSHLFVFDNSYVISSYIAHSNLYATHIYRPDIFIYPSIQADKKSVNFAIHPNSVTSKLSLNKVLKLKVKELNKDEQSCIVSILSVGINKDNNLHWAESNEETEIGREMIKVVNEIFHSDKS